MNKQEIEHKLAQAETDRDIMLVEANKEVKRLEDMFAEAQLAEAEKPVLRHGDYGFEDNEHPTVLFRKDGKGNLKSIRESFGVNAYNDTPLHDYDILGNIFADLKAIAEPLDDFEMEIGRIYVLFSGGDLVIKDTMNDGSVHIPKGILHDFILNLRRIEATMKAKT